MLLVIRSYVSQMRLGTIIKFYRLLQNNCVLSKTRKIKRIKLRIIILKSIIEHILTKWTVISFHQTDAISSYNKVIIPPAKQPSFRTIVFLFQLQILSWPASIQQYYLKMICCADFSSLIL